METTRAEFNDTDSISGDSFKAQSLLSEPDTALPSSLSCSTYILTAARQPSIRSDSKLQSSEIALHLRALEAKESAWGPNHVSTLETFLKVAKLHARNGLAAEARETFGRAQKGVREGK